MDLDGSTISSLVSRFSLRYTNCAKTDNLIAKTIPKAKQIAELQALTHLRPISDPSQTPLMSLLNEK